MQVHYMMEKVREKNGNKLTETPESQEAGQVQMCSPDVFPSCVGLQTGPQPPLFQKSPGCKTQKLIFSSSLKRGAKHLIHVK